LALAFSGFLSRSVEGGFDVVWLSGNAAKLEAIHCLLGLLNHPLLFQNDSDQLLSGQLFKMLWVR